jgi:hypothetical protein
MANPQVSGPQNNQGQIVAEVRMTQVILSAASAT